MWRLALLILVAGCAPATETWVQENHPLSDLNLPNVIRVHPQPEPPPLLNREPLQRT